MYRIFIMCWKFGFHVSFFREILIASLLIIANAPTAVHAAGSDSSRQDDKLLASLIKKLPAKLCREDMAGLRPLLHSRDKDTRDDAELAECLCRLEFFDDPASAFKAVSSGIPDESQRSRATEYILRMKDGKPGDFANVKAFLGKLCSKDNWKKDSPWQYAAALLVLAKSGLQVESAAAIDELMRSTSGFDSIVSLYFAGEMQMYFKDYKKAYACYDLALRRYNYKPSSVGTDENEPAGSFRDAFAKLIDRKRNEAKGLIDSVRLGTGYALFREAEIARRQKSDFMTAILTYDELLSSPGEGIEPSPAKTEFGEAAKAYRIKCLLALSSPDASAKAKEYISKIEVSIASLKTQLAEIKKAGAGKTLQDMLAAEIEKQTLRLATAKKMPLGAEAAKAAFEQAKLIISVRPSSSYEGELLLDLGDHLMEKELNLEEALKYFKQASESFETEGAIAAASELLKILPDAQKESAPPAAERKKDSWGNILRNEIAPGQLFNRRTCPWYLSYYRKEAAMRLGFVHFFKGDMDKAKTEWLGISKADPFLDQSEKMGFGSVTKRLIWNIDHNGGCLYATPPEMKAFKEPKLRLAVMLADLSYENEDRNTALKRYDKLLSGSMGGLTKEELGYLLFVKGVCLSWLKGSEAALKHLEENYNSIKGTPSEPRALLAMGGRASALNTREGVNKAIGYYESLVKKYPKTEQALDATYFLALCHLSLSDEGQARKYMVEYIEKKKDGGYVAFARKCLEKIGNGIKGKGPA